MRTPSHLMQISTPTISRKRALNGVMFRRVQVNITASQSHDSDIKDRLEQELKTAIMRSPHWEGISIINNLPIQLTFPGINSHYPNVFVDFLDTPDAQAIIQVMGKQIYLLGLYIHSVQALNFQLQSPQCRACFRWGCTERYCRASSHRCLTCIGHHDKRHHPQFPDRATSCFNCGKGHHTDFTECTYFENRRNRSWLQAHSPPHTIPPPQQDTCKTSDRKGN